MGLEVGDDPLGEMRNLVFRVWGSDLPLDVLPDPDEPWYSGPGGEDRNPRDGLVSVVGITLGSEAWEDLNGNGQWDTGEPHTDLPEPLLDVDDDGVFTPGVDRFYDSNGDGEYTGPNNQYDARTYIWIAYKLLLTGPPDFSVSNVTTFPEDGAIPNGEHGELLVLLLDQNLNPIAGFSDRQDHLAFSGIIPPSLFVPYEEMPLFTNIGMDFDAQGRVEHFWTEHQLGHTMHIRDDYPETVEATPIPWSLTISVHTTPGPLECSDHTFCPIWVDQETYEFADPVVGTVQ